MVVRHQIENILFEIRSGAADRVDFVLPYHFRQGEPQLGRAHSARHRY